MKIIFLAVVLSLSTTAFSFTDQMALEEGMTPLEEMGMNAQDLESIMEFDRSEYVSTIPSTEDIENVIKSHRQVIVINKAVKGKDAQTLRVYENGVIKPLMEKRTVKTKVNKKTKTEIVEEMKEFVKISTGREKQEIAESGRKYFSSTPKGFFRPQRVYKMYYSNTWKTDMPNAVFINCGGSNFTLDCGIALHATSPSHYPELGKRDSGGCIRTKQEVSDQLRKMVMETGLGSQPGQFGIKNEGYRRDRIINNFVSVDLVSLKTGEITAKKVNSWDTVIVIYE